MVRGACPPPITGGRMPRRVTLSAVLSALGLSAIRAFWLALALTASPRAADAADKLVLQLHRAAQFEFAGYYAAQWRGFSRSRSTRVLLRKLRRSIRSVKSSKVVPNSVPEAFNY